MPRGSFVGTPLYVSPEMLNESRGGPANDLWALGCVVYQMLVGQVPFKGAFEQEVFDKITSRELEFPFGLEAEAVDIIDRLLHLDPAERLGAGEPGSGNDWEALKAHPFFKGINFKLLNQTAPPVPADRFSTFLKDRKSNYKQRELDEVIAKGAVDDADLEELGIKKNDEPTKETEEFKLLLDTVVKRQKGILQRDPCLNLKL